jgi:hypothetical protein
MQKHPIVGEGLVFPQNLSAVCAMSLSFFSPGIKERPTSGLGAMIGEWCGVKRD